MSMKESSPKRLGVEKQPDMAQPTLLKPTLHVEVTTKQRSVQPNSVQQVSHSSTVAAQSLTVDSYAPT